jgi:ferric-dicitrate binding protein FerR (iron transport regulator)
MQNDYQEIGTLLAKWPHLTEQEQEQLDLWRQASTSNEQIFQELTSDEVLLKSLELYEEFKSDEGRKWIKLLYTIGEEASLYRNEPERSKEKRRVSPALMAAASVLIVVGSLWLGWHRFTEKKTVQEGSRENKSLQPGGYKARLYLADGSLVELDNSKKDFQIQQGSVKVYHQNGGLIYEGGKTDQKVLYNTLVTGHGETYSTVLSDGTKVWLNAASSLRYPVSFSGEMREVSLTGEGYFEVTPSVVRTPNGTLQKKSFFVLAGGTKIEVVGTHFNVKGYLDELLVQTTLLEGKVHVRDTGTHRMVSLEPGQQAQFDRKTGIMTKALHMDGAAIIAWRDGFFQFRNADLRSVMSELARWYGIEIVYEGSEYRDTFNGRIARNNKLEDVLKILETNQVHFTLQGKKLIVSP